MTPDVNNTFLLDFHLRHPREGVVELGVVGEVDSITTELFAITLAEVLSTHCQRMLIVDLSRVRFLSSSGLAVLVHAQREAHKRDISLRIVHGGTHAVRRALEVIGLGAFDTYEAVTNATTP